MICSDETKKEILATIVGFTIQHEKGFTAEELLKKSTAFLLLLNQKYGADEVREVLKALHDNMTRPLN